MLARLPAFAWRGARRQGRPAAPPMPTSTRDDDPCSAMAWHAAASVLYLILTVALCIATSTRGWRCRARTGRSSSTAPTCVGSWRLPSRVRGRTTVSSARSRTGLVRRTASCSTVLRVTPQRVPRYSAARSARRSMGASDSGRNASPSCAGGLRSGSQPRDVFPLLAAEPGRSAGAGVLLHVAGVEGRRNGHVAPRIAEDPFQQRLRPRGDAE